MNVTLTCTGHKLSKSPVLLAIVSDMGVRPTGHEINGKHYEIPEMIPELIVPDLKDFKVLFSNISSTH